MSVRVAVLEIVGEKNARGRRATSYGVKKSLEARGYWFAFERGSLALASLTKDGQLVRTEGQKVEEVRGFRPSVYYALAPFDSTLPAGE